MENHNPGRRRCSIRLDSDPEGRPRRILDQAPPARTTTTMGFFNLPRIYTRLWWKLRSRTSNLMSTSFYALCFFYLPSHIVSRSFLSFSISRLFSPCSCISGNERTNVFLYLPFGIWIQTRGCRYMYTTFRWVPSVSNVRQIHGAPF